MQPHRCIIRACKSYFYYRDESAGVNPKMLRIILTGDYAPIVTCQSNGRFTPVHNLCLCMIYTLTSRRAGHALSGWRAGIAGEGYCLR